MWEKCLTAASVEWGVFHLVRVPAVVGHSPCAGAALVLLLAAIEKYLERCDVVLLVWCSPGGEELLVRQE